MGTSIRRTVLWLVLAALAIAAAGWMAMGASATIDAGAPPVTGDVTGELKIVKNLGGNWPDGAFIFTWVCTDGQSGSATFPDDFTGANFETDEEYPLGTVCTVEETDGVLSVDDYDVTTHIEGTSGFQTINPRDVPIDNSTGQNVIQYMNDAIERLPKEVKITKNVIGGPLSVSDFEFEIFCDMGDYQQTVTIPGPGNSEVFAVPGTLTDCKVTEQPADGYTTTGESGEVKTLNLQEPTEWVITNTFVEPEPESYRIQIVKDQEGGDDDTSFDFTIVCAMGDSGPIGTEDPVSVLGNDKSGIIEIPAEYDRCTVTEVFDNGDGDRWITYAGKNPIPSRELTLELSEKDVTSFVFENRFVEPEPEIATITVVKKFEGPDDWRFGFALACEGVGLFDTVVLGGGESASSGVAFYATNGTLADDNGNGEPHGMLCGVAEQLLVGDWTVNVAVTGTDKSDTTPTEFAGTVAVFAVYPGDAITVTFENIPGYGAQPPSGIPPVIPLDPQDQ